MLELSSLCSRPSLGPRAEPAEGPLPTSPKREEVQENKLQFLISASPLLLSRTSSYRSPAEPEQGLPSRVSVLRLAGAGGKQHHSTSQQQGEKVGFGASRVQGIPKPPGGTVGPPWLFPGSHPRKVCPGNSFLCPEPWEGAASTSLCSHARTSAQLHPAGTEGHPPVLAAGLSQGSTIHTSDFS